MQRGPVGRYEVSLVSGEPVRAFVPDPLPPDPPIEWTGARQRALERATLAIGRLDSVSVLLPDPQLFLYSYVRREAVLSSQIEGTQSSLSDLLLFELHEAPGVPLDDVAEVSNYVAALEHGLARLAEGFPLVNRLMREMHARLLASGRGADSSPASFADPRTGSAAHDLATPGSSHHRRTPSRSAWRHWSASFTPTTPRCPS